MCVEIGKRLGIVNHGQNSLENLSDTFYYIPLLKQLEALLQNDYILAQVSGWLASYIATYIYNISK